MDSMRRNAQKMMPHVMALNKNPTMGMKNDRQPAPAVSKLVAYAKGGMVKSDAKQDKSMLARHNKLMHPGQKSKLKNGGMVKKYAEGGAVDKQVASDNARIREQKASAKAKIDALAEKQASVSAANKVKSSSGELSSGNAKSNIFGGESKPSFGAAFKAARAAQGAGGTFTYNGKKYSTNRADDKPVEKAASKNIGQDANEEALGYKKGGKVKGDKKKVMGTVGEAKSIMAALKKARRPATPMPGTPMAGLGMAPPMAPPMKRGGKVMKKAAGGAAKLRKKSPMPNKIKMMLYGKGG